MAGDLETVEQSGVRGGSSAPGEGATPGLLLVFGAGRPAAVTVPLEGNLVELGRDHPALAGHPDARVSRRHALVRFEHGRFAVTDLGSRNGSFADGEPARPDAPRPAARVIRVGDTLFVPLADVGPVERLGVRRHAGRVEGAALQRALAEAAQAARSGRTLHITGESGAGKEGLAQAFHAAGPAAGGPFVALNCATIPESVAERLLFGTRRGAYSGADADADGHVQAADGGTLFLDEVAELHLAVQAKLLRVLETGEVLALGATRPRKVELRFCSATHRDLRAQVASGRLREDLYFRIAEPRVVVPPLRERAEEIPWLVEGEVRRAAGEPAVHVSLVETCLVRPWPGNVRELLAAVRTASQRALAAGVARVEAAHLADTAGTAFGAEKAAPSPPPTATAARPREAPAAPTRETIEAALAAADGNQRAAARHLGVHRTQLRRWIERYGLASPPLASPAAEPDDEGG